MWKALWWWPLKAARHGDPPSHSLRLSLHWRVRHWIPLESTAAAWAVAADVAAKVSAQFVAAGADVHWEYLQSDQSM